MVDDAHKSAGPPEKQACDGRLSRKEFLTKLVKRASVAGVLLAAPQVIDKFLIPPAYAKTSTLHTRDTKHNCDTNKFSDQGTSPFHDQGTNPFHDQGTSVFHDSGSSPFHDTIDGCDNGEDFG